MFMSFVTVALLLSICFGKLLIFSRPESAVKRHYLSVKLFLFNAHFAWSLIKTWKKENNLMLVSTVY